MEVARKINVGSTGADRARRGLGTNAENVVWCEDVLMEGKEEENPLGTERDRFGF